jgi:uncharacterized protein YhaN
MQSQADYPNAINKLTTSIINTFLNIDDIFCDEKMLRTMANEKEKQREKERMKEREIEKVKVLEQEKNKNKYNVKPYDKIF